NSVVDEATTGTGPGGSGGDDTSQGGSGASVPTNGGAGGCGIDCPPSYAIVYEQGAVGTGGGTSSSGQSVTASSTTGGGPSYEMVHLQLSDHGESCALASELLPCGGFTRYTLTLPKNMLTPGIV